MGKIKVLIVDDSVFMRSTIKKIISSDSEIEVLYTAKNGREGVDKVIELQPDVVTMDIEMPVMTGLEALKEIMQKNPLPVLMVSTLTSEGADATLEALSSGAVDFITKKPAFLDMYALKEELISKIKAVAQNRLLRKRLALKKYSKGTLNNDSAATIAERLAGKARQNKVQNSVTGRKRPAPGSIKAIGIGVSTGGPVVLLEIFKSISAKINVPIFISQHMPPYFTKTLSKRLDANSPLYIKEAEDNEITKPGVVYLAQGGKHLILDKFKKIRVTEEPAEENFKPSVNVMMNSLVDIYGPNLLGIMLTGMGNDGMEGFIKLSKAGGYAIVQDPETCVVSGMVSSVIKSGAADEIIPIENIAAEIAKFF